MAKKSNIIRFEDVHDKIVTIRGQKVILDCAVGSKVIEELKN
jgi:hypothetical protein